MNHIKFLQHESRNKEERNETSILLQQHAPKLCIICVCEQTLRAGGGEKVIEDVNMCMQSTR